MQTTRLTPDTKLPLTCSRTGICCHGNRVWLNPWELLCLATEKGISVREFRDLHSIFGGIRLLFNGKSDNQSRQACNQYIENFGCSVHPGRPLACRLFPIARQIQNGEVCYMYQGSQFPCLDSCPEVLDLPQLTVAEYLEGQQTERFEQAQDAYLELMQSLADIAFMLLLDTGLAASGDRKTLAAWKQMGKEDPDALVTRIGNEWMDDLMLPEIPYSNDPVLFSQQHNELLQEKLQLACGNLKTEQELHEASVLTMAMALHLARSLGANPQHLSEHWINIAKENGALN
ncbi:YkgJ family cysteine cluster protein [Parabacteroides sp. FAFU027]|uniref:YkgJ family cysteine cluster protein n=1 Tax=Parabacteroides sp. FAFU027 TaxID=2922715 RepID=UPI001FAF8357|nr:YkgJ family cysteine cluster protein [Parabacteroides sp. FAFU027]